MKSSTVLLIAGAFVVLALLGGGAVVATLPPGTVPDIVQTFSNAIATAEGYFVAGSKPQRNNNPGDIMSGGQFVVYPTAETGWQALYNQVYLMFFGGSAIYNPSMTISQVAYHYADGLHDPVGAANWADNVAGFMGVSVDTTLQDLMTQGA
jgi:hypothetical protein